MSDEFFRPTYTFPSGAYNATEVRLYGKPGIMSSPAQVRVGDYDYAVDFVLKRINSKSSSDQQDPGLAKSNKGAGGQKSPPDNLPDEILKSGKAPTLAQIAEYPIPQFKLGLTSMFLLDSTGLDQLVMLASGVITVNGGRVGNLDPLSWGVIFGYAYEGHVYDLPRPKVMLLPVNPEDLPPNDAGYFEKRQAGYKVWIVDKLSECVEIEINRGFVEQVVLEANLPGKRSPNAYVGKMMLAHRSGRLSE